ncbi:MAG: tetratricopeptide repeat protein, partial [Candidatus Omnitrophota bacterium]
IITDLNNLATVYSYQNKYQESEDLYKRALAITEKSFGPEHQNLVLILSNIASLYEKLGKNDEAKTLQNRAKKIYESRLP